MGFTQKTAKEFFEKIKKAGIEILIDVRLNNNSQLAGFSKGRDLEYFLPEICSCKYVHKVNFAPTDDLLKRYKKGDTSWAEYVIEFNELIIKRNMTGLFEKEFGGYNKVLLLCSENEADKCHRRLLAEAFSNELGYEIKHL